MYDLREVLVPCCPDGRPSDTFELHQFVGLSGVKISELHWAGQAVPRMLVVGGRQHFSKPLFGVSSPLQLSVPVTAQPGNPIQLQFTGHVLLTVRVMRLEVSSD